MKLTPEEQIAFAYEELQAQKNWMKYFRDDCEKRERMLAQSIKDLIALKGVIEEARAHQIDDFFRGAEQSLSKSVAEDAARAAHAIEMRLAESAKGVNETLQRMEKEFQANVARSQNAATSTFHKAREAIRVSNWVDLLLAGAVGLMLGAGLVYFTLGAQLDRIEAVEAEHRAWAGEIYCHLMPETSGCRPPAESTEN